MWLTNIRKLIKIELANFWSLLVKLGVDTFHFRWLKVTMLFYFVSVLLVSEDYHNGKKDLKSAWPHRQLLGSFSLNQSVLHCAEVVESKDCSWWWWIKTWATHRRVRWARWSTFNWLIARCYIVWIFLQFRFCFPSFEKRNAPCCHRTLLCKSLPP